MSERIFIRQYNKKRKNFIENAKNKDVLLPCHCGSYQFINKSLIFIQTRFMHYFEDFKFQSNVVKNFLKLFLNKRKETLKATEYDIYQEIQKEQI